VKNVIWFKTDIKSFKSRCCIIQHVIYTNILFNKLSLLWETARR